MKLELTRRGSYAIRASLTLARGTDGDYVPASFIARVMHIPARFLPQVLADLVRAGVLETRLGRRGGYKLAKPSDSISLLDIIDATEGDARRRTCILTGRSCGDTEGPCDVHDAFFAAQSALLERLAQTTLAEVAARSDGAGTPARPWLTAPAGVQPRP